MYNLKYGNGNITITRREMEDSLASLKHLLWLAEEQQCVPFGNLGICGNWENKFGYFLVFHFGGQWPKSAYPGEPHCFPIKKNGVGLWEGINKELRIDLMKFIISKLEQLIEENPQ